MARNLEPLEPAEGIDWYLQEKAQNCSPNTVRSHRSRLGHFERWCDKNEIFNLNELTGRKLQRFKTWRRDDGDLNRVTVKTQMTTLRVFLQWAENIDAVPSNLHEKVEVPNLDKGENQRDRKIDPEEAFEILDYLRKYDYCSRTHVVFELMWHTAARAGEIRALDLDDYHPRNSYLQLKHRPRGNTPLKNKTAGERLVGLSDEICGLLDDYIDKERVDVTDEKGREPLITSDQGRLTVGTIRVYIYRVTQPCVYRNSCPKNRTITKCEATEHDHYSKCPVNYYPHAIRRGSLTYHLLRDWSKEDVGERANVTPDVLEKHYDRRTDKEKLEQRRSNVEKL